MSSSQFAEGMEPSTEPDTQAREGTHSSSVLTRFGNLLAVSSLVLLILLVFFKTCFAGASISRLCVLAEWDSVFDAWRTGRAQAYDPSLVQIFCPDYVFLANKLCKGILPLWNQHCGLGYPFVADIQSSVFAPLRFIFDFFPDVHTYNYYLICELIACAVSSFFLGRVLGLGRLASLFAAITYTFCPYNMWYMEMNLGASSCLFPLTALAFAFAAERRTLGSAILAGLAAGILILSGHPECSFFGILLSSGLLFFLIFFRDIRSKFSALFISLKLLIVAAFATIAVSAPALFPFIEYLMNGESYKYGSTYSTPVSWNGVFFNLFNPGQNGASPYLGIVAVLLFPLSMLALKKSSAIRHKVLALFSLTVLTFVLVSQLGPVQALFSKPPLTAVITRYALPYLLMLVAIGAGIGLDELSKANFAGLKNRLLLSGALFVLPALCLLFASTMSHDLAWMKAADFDAMLPPTALNQAALKRDIICALVFASLASVTLFLKQRQASKSAAPSFNVLGNGTIILLLGIIIGFVSEGSVAKLSLPLQSKFFYPESELILKLKNEQYRTISTCEYVFRPATNAVYGVNFLTVHNPLFPKRFLEFSKACGAKTDVFNQTFETTLSPLLNLASVKYVLSLKPVGDTTGNDQRFRLHYQSKNNISVYENKDAAPRAYLVPHAIFSNTAAESLAAISTSSFNSCSVVVIEDAEAASGAEREKGSGVDREKGSGVDRKKGSGTDWEKGSGADREKGSGTDREKGSGADREKGSGAEREKGSGVDREKGSGTEREKGSGTEREQDPASSYTTVSSFDSSNDNQIAIECSNPTSSWLVLTDIYYPGWNVYVDGKKSEIQRANFAFRAVHLDAGSHRVLFKYEPFSFTIGLILFAAFVLGGASAWKFGFWNRRL